MGFAAGPEGGARNKPRRRPPNPDEPTAGPPGGGMSFMLYLVGFIVFIAGLAWLATVMGVSQTYIMIGAVILLGIGIFTAATRTRSKDPA